MKRTKLFFAVPFLIITAQAQAAALINTSCATSILGTTRMDTDGKNIIACLKNDAGALVWKGMTSPPTATGTWCGYATANASGSYGCTSTPRIYSSISTCNGASIAMACPSGYSTRILSSETGSTSFGEHDTRYYTKCTKTCIAD